MPRNRFLTFVAVFSLSLLTCLAVAEASTNSFVGFSRFPINGTNFVPLVNNEAFFRDAFVGGETSISGATDGETWSATVTFPGGLPIAFSPVTFHSTFGAQRNCFVSFDFVVCGTTSIRILWFVNAQCRPTGTWTFSFDNNGAVFASPTFTLLPEVPGVPVLNQGAFAGKKYDNICFVVQVGSDGKSRKVTVPCSTPGATPWDIKAKGCVLVDAVMVLQYHGVTVGADGKPVTVENLDAWLSDPQNGGYNEVGGILLSKLRKYSNGKVTLRERIDGANDVTLRTSLCSFGPAIIPVNSPSTGEPGKHSVVAIGRDHPTNPTTWKVNDPDGGVVTTLAGKTVYGNQYYGLRVFAGPERTFAHNGRIIAHLFSPAELLFTDPLGRRTGFDPVTNTSFNEIPRAGYGEDGLEDLTSDSPADSWKEFDVVEPPDGTYELTVTGTAFGTYNLLMLTEDLAGDEQGRQTFRDIPTAPGVVHKYSLNYSATPGAPLQFSGGFDGRGQRPSDVNKFLTYANPTSSRTQLQAGETTFPLTIFYGPTILSQTFRATLNGADLSHLFAPTPGGHQVALLPLARGSNTLVLTVQGTTTSGRVATDTDRLVFLVP